MTDPRYKQLAEQIIGYSCRVQPGEHVNLRMIDIPDAMVVALIRATRAAGGIPHVDLYHAVISRELSMEATEAQYELEGRYRLQRAQDMDVHICFYGDSNSFESADVPSERMKIVSKYMREASNYTCNKRKWCVLAWSPATSTSPRTRPISSKTARSASLSGARPSSATAAM